VQKLRIIIGGFIGLYPTGGVTWDYIQYPLGFHLLGHDVYYLEDTGQYSFYKSAGRSWDDPTDTIEYLKKTMTAFGLDERWAYRDVGTGNCYGMSTKRLLEICETADIFINISASTIMRHEYMAVKKRVLIDSDPMFTQIQHWDDTNPEQSVNAIKGSFAHYTHLFSFGENIGKESCRIPTFDFSWNVTRQPICLNFWRLNGTSHSGAFTTIMNWSTRNKLIYEQEEWGQKDIEFQKFKTIPGKLKHLHFTIIAADNSKKMDRSELVNYGWHLLDPLKTIGTVDQYKKFIHQSLGEFSVAKETYVKSKSGWFSCRSACYLASGKPVITEETGWSEYIPSGNGLIAFHDMASAISAINAIASDVNKHSKAAVEIAEEYFNADKVLGNLIAVIEKNN
jgi:hypothetical protein